MAALTKRRLLAIAIAAAALESGAFLSPSAALAGPGPLAGALKNEPKVEMAPHKALYDIKMVAKKPGAQLLNISGQMYYEWKPGCDAWTTDHRFSLNYEYADGQPMKIQSTFTTYENFDGSAFSFSSSRQRNGEVYEELRGHASIEPGKPGEALYTMPGDLGFDLPAGAMFPMRHSQEVLRRAASDERFFNAVIFDGSDQDGPIEVNAFIGAPVPPAEIAEPGRGIDAKLLQTPAWRVRMAFFPVLSLEEGADYEMDAVIHNNGVISDMRVEYRDFTVSQRLAALESVTPAQEKCGNGNGNAKNKAEPTGRKKSGRTAPASPEDR